MRIADALGIGGGVVFELIGLLFAPTPAYDPEGWGYCPLSAAYPLRIRRDESHLYGFDYYQCFVDPHGVALLLLYLAAVFGISGALASRIGERPNPLRSVVAAALVSGPTIVVMATPAEDMLVAATIFVGAALFGGSILFAYLGGRLAAKNA